MDRGPGIRPEKMEFSGRGRLRVIQALAFGYLCRLLFAACIYAIWGCLVYGQLQYF
jgi:hypothetical protein